MRICEIYINGFGAFRDFRIPNLTSGLTVIAGNNEAGKSTLLSFIRYTLFGYPDARSKQNLYKPSHGGRHGGHITCVTNTGAPFTIYRFAGPKGGDVDVTMAGRRGDKRFLNDLLGRASYDIFHNIFAFSLDELQTVDSLNKSEIQGMLYSAELGLGNISLPKVEDSLRKDRDAIFTERSQKAIINNHSKDIKEKEGNIRKIQKDSERYDSLVKNRNELTEEINFKGIKKQRLSTEIRQIEDIDRSWDYFVELKSARRQLQSISEIKHFPPDGINKLNILNERIRQAGIEISGFQSESSNIKNEIADISINNKLLELRDKIEYLRSNKGQYQKESEEFIRLQLDLKGAEKEIVRSLEKLGRQWTENRCIDFDISIGIKEEMRRLDADMESSEMESRDALQSLAASEETFERVNKDKLSIQGAIDDCGLPAERVRSVIEERLDAAGKLRTLLMEYQRLTDNVKHTMEKRQNASNEMERARKTEWRDPEVLNSGVIFVVAGVSVFATIVTLVLGFFQAGILLVAIVLFIFGWIIKKKEAVNRKRLQELEKDRETESREIQKRIDELDTELVDLKDERKKTEDMIVALKEKLSAAEDIGTAEIEAIYSETQRQLEHHKDWSNLQKQFELKSNELKEIKMNMTHKESVLSDRAELIKGMKNEWKAWLLRQGLNGSLSAEGVVDTFSAVEAIKKGIEWKDDLQRRIDNIEMYIAAVENIVYEVRSYAGLFLSGQHTTSQIEQIIGLYDGFIKQSEKKRRLLAEHKKIEDKISIKNKNRENDERELIKLFSQVDTKDEESFHQKHEQFSKRTKLQHTESQALINIEKIAGSGVDDFIKGLESTDIKELSDKKTLLHTERENIDKELDDLRDERAKISSEVDRIEGPSELLLYQMKVENLRHKINEEAKRWASIQLALMFIKQARQKYEKERQPNVIKNASSIFASITDNRYCNLILPIGDSDIIVEDNNKARKTVDKLSRGTKEQLYLALRLGLIEEYEKGSEPLPLIMDDILVNFDQNRVETAAEILCKFAGGRQVFILTCHPKTVAILQKNNANIVSLDSQLS